jgi:hypothetical protein
VELPDGSLQPVILDLPPGATLDQVGGLGGTPVAIEPLPVEPPPQPEDVPVPDHPQPAAPLAPAPQADGPRSREKKAPSTRRTAGGDGRTDRPRGERKRTSESPGDGSLRRGGSPDEDRSAPRPGPDVAAAPHKHGFIDLLPGRSTATGVPNFIIREFRVPPFLLPIYQAAGIEYGIRSEILAAINEIETDYGRNRPDREAVGAVAGRARPDADHLLSTLADRRLRCQITATTSTWASSPCPTRTRRAGGRCRAPAAAVAEAAPR